MDLQSSQHRNSVPGIQRESGTHKEAVITNATNYLKFDTLFYYVTCVISVLRNVMQGMGDRVTPLIVEIRKTPLFEK